MLLGAEVRDVLPRGRIATLRLAHGPGTDTTTPDCTSSASHKLSSSVIRKSGALDLEQEPKTNNTGKPDQADADRDPVQVALGNRRTSETTRNAATEHVGQAASTALVQEHKNNHEDAGENEENLKYGDHAGILTDDHDAGGLDPAI